MTLGEFLDKISQKKPFRSSDVLISFDDGSYSVYEQGMPLLKKYEIPAVLFVIPSLIDTSTAFWWDEILYYTNDYNKVRWAKTVSNKDRLEYIEQLRTQTGKPPFQQQQLTLNELRDLEKNGIAIANHTMTHPMLDKVTEAELDAELFESADYLKANGFKYYDVLAYPNGNISDRVIDKLKHAGYRAGFLFNHQLLQSLSSPYKLSRLSMNDYTPLWKFRLILSGVHTTLLNLKRRFLR